jgi:hypothetical protein
MIMPIPHRSILAAALAAAASCPAAAVEVGHIEGLTPAYASTPDSAAAAKPVGDSIAEHEWLDTSSARGLHVRLSDGAQLTIGTDSRLRVDSFVYDAAQDGDNGTDKAAISLPIGVVRYVSGKMRDGTTTIETPTASLMLRSTNVAIAVNQIGETLVVVDDGVVAVRNKSTGNQVTIGAGDMLDIKAVAAANLFIPSANGSVDVAPETAAKSESGNTGAQQQGNEQQRRNSEGGKTASSSNGGSSNGGGKQSGAGRGGGGSQPGAGAGRDGPPRPGGAGAGRDGPPKPGGAGASR